MVFGGAKLLYMNKKQIIKYLNSLILLPFFLGSMNGNLALDTNRGIATLLNPKENIEINKSILTSDEDKITEAKKDASLKHAQKIDAYFGDQGLPLSGHGAKMVEAAEKYGLDWRLLPAVAMRESTGGKFACKSVSNSPFGYGSCKINFETMEESIETVAKNLAGKNPRTARFYDGELFENLENYNGRAVAHYADSVIAIMNKIGDEKELS